MGTGQYTPLPPWHWYSARGNSPQVNANTGSAIVFRKEK